MKLTSTNPCRRCLFDPCRCVPCDTCGTPTPMAGTRRCDPCWEVERRLADYLRTEGGRKFARAALAEADPGALATLAERITGEAVKVFRGMLPHETGSYNAKVFRAAVVELLTGRPAAPADTCTCAQPCDMDDGTVCYNRGQG